MTNVRTRKGYNEAPVAEPLVGPDGKLSRAWQDWTDDLDQRVIDNEASVSQAAGAPTQAEFNDLVVAFNNVLTKMINVGLMRES